MNMWFMDKGECSYKCPYCYSEVEDHSEEVFKDEFTTLCNNCNKEYMVVCL